MLSNMQQAAGPSRSHIWQAGGQSALMHLKNRVRRLQRQIWLPLPRMLGRDPSTCVAEKRPLSASPLQVPLQQAHVLLLHVAHLVTTWLLQRPETMSQDEDRMGVRTLGQVTLGQVMRPS